MPTYPAPDLMARASALMARITARGAGQTLYVWERVPLLDEITHLPVGRTPRLVGQVAAYQGTSGGSAQPAQEGERASNTVEMHYPYNPTTAPLLTDANYPQRWLTIDDDPHQWHVLSLTVTGPWVYLTMASGGLTDAAGNVR